MDRFDVSPRRSFGQHFVVDPNTVRRIARLSGAGPADSVVEIGAGLGSLTLALAETGASVRAVEVDSGLARALREVVAEAGARGVEVVEGTLRPWTSARSFGVRIDGCWWPTCPTTSLRRWCWTCCATSVPSRRWS